MEAPGLRERGEKCEFVEIDCKTVVRKVCVHLFDKWHRVSSENHPFSKFESTIPLMRIESSQISPFHACTAHVNTNMSKERKQGPTKSRAPQAPDHQNPKCGDGRGQATSMLRHISGSGVSTTLVHSSYTTNSNTKNIQSGLNANLATANLPQAVVTAKKLGPPQLFQVLLGLDVMPRIGMLVQLSHEGRAIFDEILLCLSGCDDVCVIFSRCS